LQLKPGLWAYLGPGVLICCSIHLGYYKRLDTTKMFCKLVIYWLQCLAMATPGSINLSPSN